MKMRYLIIVLTGLFFIQNATAGTCYETDCTQEQIAAFCGVNALNFKCIWKKYSGSGDDECDNGMPCYCGDSNRIFWYDVGCVCGTGTYGTLSGACTACPSGGTSDIANNTLITNCYTIGDAHNAAAHATVNQICYYSTSTSSYSTCSISSVVSCDAGYYRVNASDQSCVAVGTDYYSVSPFSRTLCPTYTNPSGGSSYGKTTGSGTGADSITDCKIPETEVFNDSAGSWVYEGGCAYSN
ncbi:MAG: hypothetical protein LBF37_03400 [Rickettsiales bacterium]|nr:hypothetical protein [Rickettsiales bacterium]